MGILPMPKHQCLVIFNTKYENNKPVPTAVYANS